ncbi:MAG: hypothetical protein KA232_11985 [Chryseobacterium sp.]|nr:hypothetical protein [Chryseobacterium sp.]
MSFSLNKTLECKHSSKAKLSASEKPFQILLRIQISNLQKPRLLYKTMISPTIGIFFKSSVRSSSFVI